MIFKKNHVQIGVDMTADTIRAVKIMTHKKEKHIEDSAVIPLRKMDDEALLAAFLALKQQFHYQKEPIILSLHTQHILTERIPLERPLTDAEVESYIHHIACPRWGQPIEAMCYDYYLMNRLHGHDMLVIAVQRKFIDFLCRAFQAAHCVLKAIDVDILAIGRLLNYLEKHLIDEPTVFALMRDHTTKLCRFTHTTLLNITQVDGCNESTLGRAQQLFEQTYPKVKIKNLILLDPHAITTPLSELLHANIMHPIIKKKKLNLPDKHTGLLWVAIALALREGKP